MFCATRAGVMLVGIAMGPPMVIFYSMVVLYSPLRPRRADSTSD
jgi:hypothetical protein